MHDAGFEQDESDRRDAAAAWLNCAEAPLIVAVEPTASAPSVQVVGK